MTESEELRKKGNAISESYNGSQKSQHFLMEALEYYNKASNCARTDDELASSNTNCAFTTWKIIQHMKEQPKYTHDVIGAYTTTINYFITARSTGINAGKSNAWIDKLGLTFSRCLDDALDYISQYSRDQLEQCPSESECLLKLLFDHHQNISWTCCYKLTECLLSKAERSFKQNDLRKVWYVFYVHIDIYI